MEGWELGRSGGGGGAGGGGGKPPNARGQGAWEDSDDVVAASEAGHVVRHVSAYF